MNQRIQELQHQAISLVLNGNDPDGDVERMYIPAEFTTKFAELIVRECAQVLETNGDNQRTIRMTESTGHDKTTDWMEGYEEAVKQYGGFLLKKNAKQIKKHFGVEE
jgi:hypothetical protein